MVLVEDRYVRNLKSYNIFHMYKLVAGTKFAVGRDYIMPSCRNRTTFTILDISKVLFIQDWRVTKTSFVADSPPT